MNSNLARLQNIGDNVDDSQSRTAGLPLGPLNPLKSIFKRLVPNVPKSQKSGP